LCGYEFPKKPEGKQVKKCLSCGALNLRNADTCHACGKSFLSEFTLTLEEALRVGVIVRGMDLDEREVQGSEEISSDLKRLILKSGDQHLIRFLKTVPEESYSRLGRMLDEVRSGKL
jgi:hypothetical protein